MNYNLFHDTGVSEPLPAQEGTNCITADWLLNLPKNDFNSPVIKWLDDTHILYSFQSPENNSEWTIERINIRTNERKILGEGSSPKPSPDGQWILFINGKKEKKQLWIMRNYEDLIQNKKQITNVIGGLDNYSFEFAWAPNSKHIAFVYQQDEPTPAQSKIEIINRVTGYPQQIASFDAGINYLSWLPNGFELLFVAERMGALYNEKDDIEEIQTLNIIDGKIRVLAKFDGLQQFLRPTCSPDGKLIALMYDAENPTYNFMPSLGIIYNDDYWLATHSVPVQLTFEIKLFSPQWSNDSQRIYVRRGYGAYTQIYSVDIKTGVLYQITNGSLDIESFAISPDGLHIAWLGQNAHATRIIRVASDYGNNARDLLIIPFVPDNVALSEVREINWISPGYPSIMCGLLLMPLEYQKETSYPLIVDVHGGGGGARILLFGGILLNTPLEWQMWTAKGYAVFVPEFRSSASFGSIAITRDLLIEHDLVNCDCMDIQAGIDELIHQGIVDGDRIAVIGHSAGARRVNWLLATTHRFRAVVSKEGWADEWIRTFSMPPSNRLFLMFGGAPWEVPQNYFKNSALLHCNGATTPSLFLMGNHELGGADPSNTVNMLYNAIKTQGVNTEYIKYSDEGHVFENFTNRKDALERTIKWIDEHVK